MDPFFANSFVKGKETATFLFFHLILTKVNMITRFAPSPTGRLHLGHVASALFTARASGAQKYDFILRIEDIDLERCKPEFTKGIYEDLEWLGFSWPTPVRIQSQHMEAYIEAFNKLDEMGLLYPCFCSRKEIREEAIAAGQAPHANDIGFVYTGTCKYRPKVEGEDRPPVWRLNMEKSLEIVGPDLTWHDRIVGEVKAQPELFGDVVIARRDIPTSYHLSVTVDDALQGVDLVTRGQDLFVSTHIHRLLQALLDLPTPLYHHHPLLTDEVGQRLAKRKGSLSLNSLREAGQRPKDILHRFEKMVDRWFV